MIDSIAAVFRADDSPDDPYGKVDRGAEYAARAKSMLALAARLKQLSHRYNLAVIVTNQVADKPAEALDERRLSPWERGASLAEGSLHDGLRLPALGISWALAPSSRAAPLRSKAATPCREAATLMGRCMGQGRDPMQPLWAAPPCAQVGQLRQHAAAALAPRRDQPRRPHAAARRAAARRTATRRTAPRRTAAGRMRRAATGHGALPALRRARVARAAAAIRRAAARRAASRRAARWRRAPPCSHSTPGCNRVHPGCNRVHRLQPRA